MEPYLFHPEAEVGEIERAIRLILEPAEYAELRVMNAEGSGTVSGYYDRKHRSEMARDAAHWSGKAPGVYSTINPVKRDPACRAVNHMKRFAKFTTKDDEIESRTTLLIDFDPERPAGISSTDAEHQAALLRARDCRDFLLKLGWPDPILADSGNGGHLVYRIALLNDQASAQLLKRILDTLASRFSDPSVAVDRTVFNAARVSRLYGTVTAKGDHTTHRPHRTSRILEAPERLDAVPTELLVALPETHPGVAVTMAEGDRDEDFDKLVSPRVTACEHDVKRWAEEHNIPVVEWKPYRDRGVIGIINPCPWNPAHTNKSAYIGQLENGIPFAGCHHNSCADHGFDELRDVVEPGWRASEDVRPLEAVDDPHRLARDFLESESSHPDGPTLRYHNGGWFIWEGAAYREEPPDSLESRLNAAIKRAFDAASVDAQRRGDAKRSFARPVTNTVVSNVKSALRSQVIIPPSLSPPCWVGGEGPWEAMDVLSARNGLFHIPSLAWGVDDHLEPTPRFFSTFSLDYAIDPNAPRPAAWLGLLDQLWPDDPGCIATLQEWFGYILTPDTRQQKILGLIGPPRGGKGTIGRVMTALVGGGNVAGSTVSSLKSNFGLQALLGKTLAIIADAELRRHDDILVERLKTISGEDLITIDKKYVDPINVRLPTRLVLISNDLPRFKDPSGALANRFILLRLTRSFLGEEDLTLADRLLAELPGILLWAVEGWKRLRERGRLTQPVSGVSLLEALQDLGSPVGRFVRECCRVDSHAMVPKETLYDAYVAWWRSKGNDYPLAANSFGAELRAVVPGLDVSHPVIEGKQVWCYTGIAVVKPAAPSV